jgi:hypothetical protein
VTFEPVVVVVVVVGVATTSVVDGEAVVLPAALEALGPVVPGDAVVVSNPVVAGAEVVVGDAVVPRPVVETAAAPLVAGAAVETAVVAGAVDATAVVPAGAPVVVGESVSRGVRTGKRGTGSNRHVEGNRKEAEEEEKKKTKTGGELTVVENQDLGHPEVVPERHLNAHRPLSLRVKSPAWTRTSQLGTSPARRSCNNGRCSCDVSGRVEAAHYLARADASLSFIQAQVGEARTGDEQRDGPRLRADVVWGDTQNGRVDNCPVDAQANPVHPQLAGVRSTGFACEARVEAKGRSTHLGHSEGTGRAAPSVVAPAEDRLGGPSVIVVVCLDERSLAESRVGHRHTREQVGVLAVLVRHLDLRLDSVDRRPIRHPCAVRIAR